MTSTTIESAIAARPAGTARAVVAASVGNMLEWYDFTVYALFSIYLAEAFFPGGGSTLERVVPVWRCTPRGLE